MNKVHYKKTNSILDRICETKIQEIEELQRKNINSNNLDTRYSASFKKALEKEGLSIISEIKKASPSEGIIRKNFDVIEIAQIYQNINIDAVSVLTDKKFFQGSNVNLTLAKNYISKPILRKEFILDETQIFESKAMEADAILLIVSILEESRLQDLYQVAKSIGLDVIVETHDESEIEIAINIDSDIIGINNRNLKTFKTDINNFPKLSTYIPDNIIKVAESGIRTKKDVDYLKENSADAILIGSQLMREQNIEETVNKLFN